MLIIECYYGKFSTSNVAAHLDSGTTNLLPKAKAELHEDEFISMSEGVFLKFLQFFCAFSTALYCGRAVPLMINYPAKIVLREESGNCENLCTSL